jgi:hypothetical protein
MKTKTYRDTDQALLGLLQDAAPTPADYARVVQDYYYVIGEIGQGNPSKSTLWLLGRVYDGMRYGNWPWVQRAAAAADGSWPQSRECIECGRILGPVEVTKRICNDCASRS